MAQLEVKLKNGSTLKVEVYEEPAPGYPTEVSMFLETNGSWQELVTVRENKDNNKKMEVLVWEDPHNESYTYKRQIDVVDFDEEDYED